MVHTWKKKVFWPLWIPTESKSGIWMLNNFGRLIFFLNGWFGKRNVSRLGMEPEEAPFCSVAASWPRIRNTAQCATPTGWTLPSHPIKSLSRAGWCVPVGSLQKAGDTWMNLWMSADNLSTQVSVFLLVEKLRRKNSLKDKDKRKKIKKKKPFHSHLPHGLFR